MVAARALDLGVRGKAHRHPLGLHQVRPVLGGSTSISILGSVCGDRMQSALCVRCATVLRLGGRPGIPRFHLFVRVMLWGGDNMRGTSS